MILYLLCFNGMSLGLFLGSAITDSRTLTAINPFVAQVLSLFSGFYKNFNSMPDWVKWIQYLSPIRYSFQALVEN
jgi:ATP-binding cassette, subfamily G (WHITE), eye pigment precursor transporter